MWKCDQLPLECGQKRPHCARLPEVNGVAAYRFDVFLERPSEAPLLLPMDPGIRPCCAATTRLCMDTDSLASFFFIFYYYLGIAPPTDCSSSQSPPPCSLQQSTFCCHRCCVADALGLFVHMYVVNLPQLDASILRAVSHSGRLQSQALAFLDSLLYQRPERSVLHASGTSSYGPK